MERDVTTSHNITFCYAGSELFTELSSVVDSLPANSHVLTNWSKRNNTISTDISNLSTEDILYLKLKFTVVKIKQLI